MTALYIPATTFLTALAALAITYWFVHTQDDTDDRNHRRHPPLYQWPPICWLLTGLPTGALLGFGLDGYALHHSWWTDPTGISSGLLVLLGVILGAGIWCALIAISTRRCRRHHTIELHR